MIRVLVTGMSGTGKTTVLGQLAERGYRAVDTDGSSTNHVRDITRGGSVDRAVVVGDTGLEPVSSHFSDKRN